MSKMSQFDGGNPNVGMSGRPNGGSGPRVCIFMRPDGGVKRAVKSGVVEKGPLLTSPLDDQLVTNHPSCLCVVACMCRFVRASVCPCVRASVYLCVCVCACPQPHRLVVRPEPSCVGGTRLGARAWGPRSGSPTGGSRAPPGCGRAATEALRCCGRPQVELASSRGARRGPPSVQGRWAWVARFWRLLPPAAAPCGRRWLFGDPGTCA